MSHEIPFIIPSVKRVDKKNMKPQDFVIRYTPELTLHTSNVINELALDEISMTYSWYNVRPEYKNDTFKYSHDGGKSWNDVKINPGVYDYNDINHFLHLVMDDNDHVNDDETYDINILMLNLKILS